MKPSWFWCLEHKQVEEGFGCGSTTRAGPYRSREEAVGAPQRLRARAEEQEARDEAERQKRSRR